MAPEFEITYPGAASPAPTPWRVRGLGPMVTFLEFCERFTDPGSDVRAIVLPWCDSHGYFRATLKIDGKDCEYGYYCGSWYTLDYLQQRGALIR